MKRNTLDSVRQKVRADMAHQFRLSTNFEKAKDLKTSVAPKQTLVSERFMRAGNINIPGQEKQIDRVKIRESITAWKKTQVKSKPKKMAKSTTVIKAGNVQYKSALSKIESVLKINQDSSAILTPQGGDVLLKRGRRILSAGTNSRQPPAMRQSLDAQRSSGLFSPQWATLTA